MNILFLTLTKIDDITENRGIYIDLMRKFSKEGHNLFIVSSLERRFGKQTQCIEHSNVKYLNVKTLNIKKTNFIEKGLGILLLEYQYKRAIQIFFPDVKFDLILYSTPPITFTKVVKYLKKRNNATSYLLLKDIFPQNAVDLGLMKKNDLLHLFFKKKERDLYDASDFIGCMSPQNKEYIKQFNPSLSSEKIEVCPNSIEVIESENGKEFKNNIRRQYGIPEETTVFLYGGNLGKPQGVDFLREILKSNNNKTDRFFVIIGSGTEMNKIEKWFLEDNYTNALQLSFLPKKEYDLFIKCADVGLIFLNKNFTIPNYPSRLLVYLENKMPILAATDLNTDIGKIAAENNYGFWCENGDIIEFNKLIETYTNNPGLISDMGESGFAYLKENYTVNNTYGIILKHFQ